MYRGLRICVCALLSYSVQLTIVLFVLSVYFTLQSSRRLTVERGDPDWDWRGFWYMMDEAECGFGDGC